MSEIDERVAREVMGWELGESMTWGGKLLYRIKERYGWCRIPPYSTNIAHAWEVVEKIKSDKFSIRHAFIDALWEEMPKSNDGLEIFASWWIFYLTPLAICKAARKAKEKNEGT